MSEKATHLPDQLATLLNDDIENECYSCTDLSSYNKNGDDNSKEYNGGSMSARCASEFPEWFIDSWTNSNEYLLQLYYGTLTPQQIKLWEDGIREYSSEIHDETLVISIIHEPNNMLSKPTYNEICSVLNIQSGAFEYVATSRCGVYIIYEGVTNNE